MTKRPQERSTASLSLAFAIVYPTVLTLAYFNWFADGDGLLQRVIMGVGKLAQFGFPAFWVYIVRRESPVWTSPNSRGMGWSLTFGVVIFFTMLLLYRFALLPMGVFEAPRVAIEQKVREIGVDTPLKFVALGVFYALFHSLLEEYFWRWFVFARLRQWMSFLPAMVISSLGFMSHHVIIMATFFGWQSVWTYFFSLSVAVGGAFWAWSYENSRSLYAPWASHLLIDAAVFLVGYHLVF